MPYSPLPPFHTAQVLYFTLRDVESKAELCYDLPNDRAPLVIQVGPCQTASKSSGSVQPAMDTDKTGAVLPFDGRAAFRNLVDVGGKSPTDEVSDMSLAEIARLSGAEVLASFGARLREARKERRLKQEEVGAAVGVTRQTVAAWEAARAAPESLSEGRIRKLAELLNCRYEWLRFGQEPMRDGFATDPAQAAASTADLKGKLREILRALRQAVRQIEDLTDD